MSASGLLTLYLVGCWYIATVVLTPHAQVFSPRFFGLLAFLAGALVLGSSVGFAAWLVLARFVLGLDHASVIQCARGGLPGKVDRWMISRLYPVAPLQRTPTLSAEI